MEPIWIKNYPPGVPATVELDAGETLVSLAENSFRDYADMVDKMQAYSTLAARQMAVENRRPGMWSPVTHGAWMFVRTYIFERGFLEGLDGLVIAALNAGGSFLKYAKRRESMRHARGGPHPGA